MNDLENLYQQLILEHSRLRQGSGELPGWDASSHQLNPTCGDEVTLQVKLAGDKVDQLVWNGHGCSISQASLSIMWELVNGQTLAEVDSLIADFRTMMHSRGGPVDEAVLDHLEDATAFQGVSKYVNRVKCALLGWMALTDALAKARSNGGGQGISEGENLHCCAINSVSDSVKKQEANNE